MLGLTSPCYVFQYVKRHHYVLLLAQMEHYDIVGCASEIEKNQTLLHQIAPAI